jgi:hypothetical protein
MKTIDKKTIIIAAATLVIGLLAGWLIFGGNRFCEKAPLKSTFSR